MLAVTRALRFRADVLAVTRALRFRDWRNSGCGLSSSAGRARAAGTFQKCGLSWPENMRTIRSCEGSVSAHLDVRHQMMMTHFGQYNNTTNGKYATIYAACTCIQAACFDIICQFPKLLI